MYSQHPNVKEALPTLIAKYLNGVFSSALDGKPNRTVLNIKIVTVIAMAIFFRHNVLY
ncbi:hypothetical protein NSMS1_66690 (plasmid) [Nostoc sp. MS1]|nr:hypothetical protein NSMS1_66690 [Nostoc sp. MS1]